MRADLFEKEYINTGNNAFDREVNDYLEGATYAIEILENLVLHTQTLAQLAQIKKEIAQYRSEFAALSEAIQKRGATENVGIRGQLRSVAHQIEEYVAAPRNGLGDEHVLYLNLRRHEKDYIMRDKVQYLERRTDQAIGAQCADRGGFCGGGGQGLCGSGGGGQGASAADQ